MGCTKKLQHFLAALVVMYDFVRQDSEKKCSGSHGKGIIRFSVVGFYFMPIIIKQLPISLKNSIMTDSRFISFEERRVWNKKVLCIRIQPRLKKGESLEDVVEI
ncbi:hypothetical protein TNCT_267611 [Trichonephila clavata]|uniref:Uncharacterized protein n=1 Tax=Trichonephila clavata TaxID=2740835 RepID=A0A8X6L366_TRICU|nr:hypothetical protein TNCT_267611 [Trichonephila clavata]